MLPTVHFTSEDGSCLHATFNLMAGKNRLPLIPRKNGQAVYTVRLQHRLVHGRFNRSLKHLPQLNGLLRCWAKWLAAGSEVAGWSLASYDRQVYFRQSDSDNFIGTDRIKAWQRHTASWRKTSLGHIVSKTKPSSASIWVALRFIVFRAEILLSRYDGLSGQGNCKLSGITGTDVRGSNIRI